MLPLSFPLAAKDTLSALNVAENYTSGQSLCAIKKGGGGKGSCHKFPPLVPPSSWYIQTQRSPELSVIILMTWIIDGE